MRRPQHGPRVSYRCKGWDDTIERNSVTWNQCVQPRGRGASPGAEGKRTSGDGVLGDGWVQSCRGWCRSWQKLRPGPCLHTISCTVANNSPLHLHLPSPAAPSHLPRCAVAHRPVSCPPSRNTERATGQSERSQRRGGRRGPRFSGKIVEW